MQRLKLPRPAPATVLATGAFLKNRACLLEGRQLHWSALHGDLSTPAACAAVTPVSVAAPFAIETPASVSAPGVALPNVKKFAPLARVGVLDNVTVVPEMPVIAARSATAATSTYPASRASCSSRSAPPSIQSLGDSSTWPSALARSLCSTSTARGPKAGPKPLSVS